MNPDIVLRICDEEIGTLGEGELTPIRTIQTPDIRISRYDIDVQGYNSLANVVTLREPKSCRNLIQYKHQTHNISLQCRIHVLEDPHDFYLINVSGDLLLLVSHTLLLVFRIEKEQPLQLLFTRSLTSMELSKSRYVINAVCFQENIFFLLNDHNIYTVSLKAQIPPSLYSLQTNDIITCLEVSDCDDFLLLGTAEGLVMITDLNDEIHIFRPDCGEICGLALQGELLHALGTCGRSTTIWTTCGLLIQKSSQQDIAWRVKLTGNYALTALVPDALLLQKLSPQGCPEYSFRPSLHFGTELESIRTLGIQTTSLVAFHDYTEQLDGIVLGYSFTQGRCLYFQNILPEGDEVASKLGYPSLMCYFGKESIDLWSFKRKNDKNDVFDSQIEFPYAVHATHDDFCFSLCKVKGVTVLCEIQVPPGALRQRQSK